MTTPILGEMTIPHTIGAAWAASRGASWRWCDLAEVCWISAETVRPEVVWAQACKETGFGRFGRAVTWAHHNPCGLKIPNPSGLADDDPAAHQVFPTWWYGFRAQEEHLALYAGAPGYPLTYVQLQRDSDGVTRRWQGATADPRHFSYLYGKARNTVEGLSHNWAGEGYGESIVNDYLAPLLAWAEWA